MALVAMVVCGEGGRAQIGVVGYLSKALSRRQHALALKGVNYSNWGYQFGDRHLYANTEEFQGSVLIHLRFSRLMQVCICLQLAPLRTAYKTQGAVTSKGPAPADTMPHPSTNPPTESDKSRFQSNRFLFENAKDKKQKNDFAYMEEPTAVRAH